MGKFPVIPKRQFQVLRNIVTRLEGQPIVWAVTGSLGMALQGLSLEVHDIDLQTDKEGAFEIERLLMEYLVTPVRYLESERIRSYLGKLEMDGVQVEIMGDVQKRLENQDWEEPINLQAYRQWLKIDGLRMPVLDLEYEYQAYLRLGRFERAEMLKAWMEKLNRLPSGDDH
jgi:hypothetical protein